MSYIPQDASLQLLGLQNSTSIYQLRSDGLTNQYYVVSGDGTRHLMASPEVVGYESYLAMKPATTAVLQYFSEHGLACDVDILTILRGGLNYPLEECCYKAGIRVPNMNFISCERHIEDGIITGLDIKYEKLHIAKDITLLQGNGSSKYGSNKEYKAMIKKIKAGNPAKNPDDLQYILDNVDVENLFEYLAYEMFFGNSDIGNTRFYRFKGEGNKWKWVLYDVDYGLYSSSFDSPKSYTKVKGMGQKGIDNTIFLKLLSVPEYKDRFLTIYGNLFKQLTTDFMLAVLDEMVDLIKPEMQLHWARWASPKCPPPWTAPTVTGKSASTACGTSSGSGPPGSGNIPRTPLTLPMPK